MTVIFEGTIADLQKQLLTQSLPLEMQVRVLANVELNGRSETATANPEMQTWQVAKSLTIDQIKELAEDDGDYFLRFYRASGH